MPRAVVYDSPRVRATYQEIVRRKVAVGERPTRVQAEKYVQQARTSVASRAGSQGEAATGGGDDYVSKIAKYVPAESVTFTTAGFAAFPPHGWFVWLGLGLGAAANVLYLYAVALAGATTTPLPATYFYALSVFAYFLWAFSVLPSARAAAHINGSNVQARQAFLLLTASFLTPALDTAAGRLWPPKR